MPPEIARASCVVGFERAETWMGCRNAESYQSQERVHGVNWVEILSFQAKDDLCLSEARICSGTGYFSALGLQKQTPTSSAQNSDAEKLIQGPCSSTRI